MDKKPNNISLIQLGNYVKPDVDEYTTGRSDYVTNGKHNSFFNYVIDRYNGSPTNESIINVYSSLLYGRGIVINGQTDLYDELNDIFNKEQQRNVLNDFKKFGMATVKLVRSVGGGIGMMKHFPVNKCAMGVANSKGVIDKVYYSFDWDKTYKYKPQPIPIFMGKMTDKEMILVIKPYQSGNFYFSYPDYMAGLQYAEMEEEISNFSINHIKNGLSFGYVINFNNGGSLQPEEKDEIERRIKQKLTGSENAGRFILSFNDGKEAEVTVEKLDVNDAHNQWESLRTDAAQQILVAHGVTSPLLFGMPSAGGFGANADELNVASKLLQDYQISPKQEQFLDALKPALELAGLETDLEFLPLRENYNDETEVEEVVEDNAVQDIEEEVELSNDVEYNIEAFLSEGEDIDFENWELLDDRRCDEMTLSETQLNTVFEFARVPKDDDNIERSRSRQDTSLFKIRYRYAGNPTPERSFCKHVMFANKVFKEETLNKEQFITPKMGKGGSNTYNPFLYKGGVNCKHWWQRVIYLKKDNEYISVNQARKLILQLDPEDRDDARWQKNDPKVAQSASASNNYWRAN